MGPFICPIDPMTAGDVSNFSGAPRRICDSGEEKSVLMQLRKLGLHSALTAIALIAGLSGARAANPIAILDSSRTSTYFGLAYQYCNLNTPDPNAMGSLEYKRYWGGWEQVLKEMKTAGKIPGYDVVNDEFIANNLIASSYKVLVL